MADAPAANWTAADAERLSAQGWRVELWKGQLLRMAPTGDVHGRVTRRLDRALDRYVEAHSLGQLWPAEAGFDLTRPDEERQTVPAPDIAFVRAERVPPPVGGFAHVVPDLVVETASPTQSRQEMVLPTVFGRQIRSLRDSERDKRPIALRAIGRLSPG